jgi:hypothetical protein
MHKLEALRILEVKLAAIEQEHRAELADSEGAREWSSGADAPP